MTSLYQVAVSSKLLPEVKDQLCKKEKIRSLELNSICARTTIGGDRPPLTCLWSDLQNLDANPTKEDIIFQVKKALCIVGSTYHSLNVERRKLAWSFTKTTGVGKI